MRTVKLRIVGLVVLGCIAVVLELHNMHVWPFTLPPPRTNPDPVVRLNRALLPETEIATLPQRLQTDAKTEITSWEPTVAEMETLEANLDQVSNLTDARSGGHIENPSRYYRQYIAFARDGEKEIFINAFCQLEEAHRDDWRQHLVIVADGGTCYWRAVYDPSTHTFSSLRINGPR